MSLFHDTLDTPLGILTLEASEYGLRSIRFPNRPQPIKGKMTSNSVIKLAKRELKAYFARQLKEFSVPLDWHGTAFQESVWQALTAIPYGETVSYADIARAIGRPQSARPTGGAVGATRSRSLCPATGSSAVITPSRASPEGLTSKYALLGLEGREVE